MFSLAEPAKSLDGIPSFGLQQDSSGNAFNSSSLLGCPLPVEDPTNRIKRTSETTEPIESEASAASVRQRTQRTTPANDQQTAPKVTTEANGPGKSFPGTSTHGNGLESIPGIGKEVSADTDPVKVLDLMRCGGCLLTAFFTRWALSFGLGILFFEVKFVCVLAFCLSFVWFLLLFLD